LGLRGKMNSGGGVILEDRMNPLTVKIVRRLFFNSLFIKNIIFKILKLIRNDYNVDIVMDPN